MQIEDLSEDVTKMTEEEIRDKILETRASRRNYNRGHKKATVKAEKEDNVDFDDLQVLLNSINVEE